MCKVIKSALCETNFKRCNKFYENLGTKGGEKEVYGLAKIREKRCKDFQIIRFIKSEDKKEGANE